MINVIINGVDIDLISEGVEYTKQANDLADISTVNASFTYALKADKTPKNTQLFQQLGMVGDTSQTPYVKNTAQLLDNGVMLIEKGLATVEETNQEYKLKIQEGIVEVFKLIENKTIGNDLNLIELEHDKSESSIIESWNTEKPYKYLIADYNGKTNEGQAINAAYQIPSVSVKYLWDKMFSYLGWSYSGNLNFIKNKYITYPKPPGITETEPVVVGLGLGGSYSGAFNDAYKFFNYTTTEPEIQLIDNWKFKVLKTGRFNIYFEMHGNIETTIVIPSLSTTANGTIDYKVNLLIDNEIVNSERSGNTGQIDKELQAGTIVELQITLLEEEDLNQDDFGGDNALRNAYLAGWVTIDKLNVTGKGLNLTSIGFQDIDFREALSNFSLKDFFKEVMFRGALTPFTDTLEKHIHFQNLKERLTTNNTQDLSKFYVKRKNEFYTLNSYAQKNDLKVLHNREEEKHNNGAIMVKNKNLPDNKTLFESKFYTSDFEPANIIYNVDANTTAPRLRMWEKEINENEGTVFIEYKPLKNRFYYLSQEKVNEPISVNGSTNPFFYKASIQGTTMPEIIKDEYSLINRIFEDTRIHEIELALSVYDFRTIDLQSTKFFNQENQFYILNSIKWKTGQLAIGEFLRIKK